MTLLNVADSPMGFLLYVVFAFLEVLLFLDDRVPFRTLVIFEIRE